jgi:prephenate dehydrogenase
MAASLGTVTIQGVGLIGGSIGRTLRKRGLAERVVGLGRDRTRLERAIALGAVDSISVEPERVLPGSSLVVVCSPVSAIADQMKAAADLTPPDAVVTDAGSTKRRIAESLLQHSNAVRKCVPAHPIAGSEKSGVDHADPELFAGSTCVLTPMQATPAHAVERVSDFWTQLGCRVARLSPAEHDEMLAWVSHGPHVLAAALARCTPRLAHRFGGGAFRDVSRVAASDPDLWTAIFLENPDAVLATIDAYLDDMGDFRRLLASADHEGLRHWWRKARQARLAFESSTPMNPDHHGGD